MDIERELYKADQFIVGLFPQTPDEVRDMLTLSATTPIELPERLRDPEAVLDRIIEKQDTELKAAIERYRTQNYKWDKDGFSSPQLSRDAELIATAYIADIKAREAAATKSDN